MNTYSIINTPAYKISGSDMEHGYFIELKMAGYRGSRVTKEMTDKFRIRPVGGKVNPHDVLIFQDKQKALSVANRVDLYLTNHEEVV